MSLAGKYCIGPPFRMARTRFPVRAYRGLDYSRLNGNDTLGRASKSQQETGFGRRTPHRSFVSAQCFPMTTPQSRPALLVDNQEGFKASTKHVVVALDLRRFRACGLGYIGGRLSALVTLREQ